MPRQVKAFSGSTGGATVYTVPAGRVAKLILDYLAPFGGQSTASLTPFTTSPTVGYPPVPQRTTDSMSVATYPLDNVLSVCFGNSGPVTVKREAYLVAGEFVTATTASYRFVVIEEY